MAASGDPSEARSIAGTRALKAPYSGALGSKNLPELGPGEAGSILGTEGAKSSL